MSNTFKKTTLGAALAVALCAAPAAFAFTVTTNTNTAPERIATQAGPDIAMTEQIRLNAQISDNMIGRTTGFGVRMTLNSGIDIVSATIGAGPSLSGGGWILGAPTYGTGGSANTVIWAVSAGAGSTISPTGVFITIDALTLTGAPGSVNGLIEVFDPATNAVIASYNASLISRISGLAADCSANSGVYQIDVAGNAGFDPKTGFVPAPYDIGGASDVTTALGNIELSAFAGYTLDIATSEDTFSSKITAVDLSAFDDIFLATDDTCAVALGSYTIDYDTNTAEMDTEFFDFNTAVPGHYTTAGGIATLCVTVTGDDAISAQSFQIQNGVNGTFLSDACAVSPLVTNGSVVKVYHINPAGNTSAQSFVRVINPSNLGGLVTVEGVDDSGAAAAAPITFMLGAGESKQLNSEVLENGGAGVIGAWGDGVGKWRATVTGEFDSMRVQGMNRNATDNTVTNLTDADGQGEQVGEALFD